MMTVMLKKQRKKGGNEKIGYASPLKTYLFLLQKKITAVLVCRSSNDYIVVVVVVIVVIIVELFTLFHIQKTRKKDNIRKIPHTHFVFNLGNLSFEM